MKKIFTYLFVFTTAFGITACSDDNHEDFDYAANLDYSAEYAEQWANYMVTVSGLLKKDANDLYNYWVDENNNAYPTSYANIFKRHNGTDGLNSAKDCIEQILDGCADIANEVGSSKIGEPYSLYNRGKHTEALYAVESWYSWHSRDDYTNNIVSIRNSYLGTTLGTGNKRQLFATPAQAASLSALLAAKNPALDTKAKELIQGAATAIQDIIQPFRSHINSPEAKKAMEACAELEAFISDELKPYFDENFSDEELQPVIEQYVDAVVIPTYTLLKEKNAALDTAVRAFKANPSNAAFENCANAWLAAREPWESSEAFLFGPVDAKGLDPNMDSWPLDQVGIVNILKSKDFSDLEWTEDDSDDGIKEKQALRGFHTLEYFIFKDGKARTIQ